MNPTMLVELNIASRCGETVIGTTHRVETLGHLFVKYQVSFYTTTEIQIIL